VGASQRAPCTTCFSLSLSVSFSLSLFCLISYAVSYTDHLRWYMVGPQQPHRLRYRHVPHTWVAAHAAAWQPRYRLPQSQARWSAIAAAKRRAVAGTLTATCAFRGKDVPRTGEFKRIAASSCCFFVSYMQAARTIIQKRKPPVAISATVAANFCSDRTNVSWHGCYHRRPVRSVGSLPLARYFFSHAAGAGSCSLWYVGTAAGSGAPFRRAQRSRFKLPQ
jgi:hypothetical protein